ncbi:ClpP/crotonase-like domain-containing protein [Paraphoma chrysanthemicola]|uniref:ClpP/crotonase-like domain-containing protein n=1 Tax=Paraphoma chrysanthemicola TaxID=798071 RepID=A0A8K0R1L7_9PLEO|nr:ClpP/crotonase-like domain-containing protein [Paraphoma chrysanthemicola]
MDDHVTSRRDGSALFLTLNNVAKANSVSANMLHSLQVAFESADQDDEITAVVLTGNGKFFCTGMDFSSDGDANAELSPELHDQKYHKAVRLFDTISSCTKTTIALVNGSCYGGGNGIVFACDIRIAVRGAKFVLSEVKRGLSPATISRYLVREWGTSLAREAMVTGRVVGIEELFPLRAVHHAVEDIVEGQKRVVEVLEGLKSCAPRAVAQSKRLVNAVYEENSRESGQVIKEVFLDMTKPSDEADYGISQFRKGVRTVDWESWYKSRTIPKL